MRLVSRTIEVLRLLGQTPDGVGVTRLAEQLGESPSTVHRLLAALLEHDYVAQTEDRRYRLGVGVLGLAHAFQRQDRLVTMARPYLSKLAAQTRESVFLAERIGDDVICVASAESPRLLSFYLRLGQRTPYHAASSARAILAFQEPAEQRRLLETERFVSFTGKTPMTLHDAASALAVTRERGFAICDEELEVGVAAVSVPVMGINGVIDASLTLVAPYDRLGPSAWYPAACVLSDAAQAIAGDMGFDSTDGPVLPLPRAEAIAGIDVPAPELSIVR
jgi:IclR family acetate operon transcriptional repressor